MKKALLIFCFIFALVLSSCQTPSDPNAPVTNNPSAVTTQASLEETPSEVTNAPTPTDDPAEDDAYLSLQTYEPTSYGYRFLGYQKDPYALGIRLPSEWSFLKDSAQNTLIQRDGRTIGQIYPEQDSDLSAWKVVKTESIKLNGVEVESRIEKTGIGTTLAFRYCITYHYAVKDEMHAFTLAVDYEEISLNTGKSLMTKAMTIQSSTDPQYGVLMDDEEPTNILILGNSFINSSNIGTLLQDVINANGKECYVDARSIGMAQVGTHISNTSLMQKIANGYYDAVFICGFYAANEVTNLGILKSYCDLSQTKLAIFPAHNENESVVNNAINTYPELALINWQVELDALINYAGIDHWTLCTNDYYGHTDDPGGLVGAMMIYRALYGENPDLQHCQYYNQSYATALLGDYVQNGFVTMLPAENLIYVD